MRCNALLGNAKSSTKLRLAIVLQSFSLSVVVLNTESLKDCVTVALNRQLQQNLKPEKQ